MAKLNTSWGVEEELEHPSDLQANCEQADTEIQRPAVGGYASRLMQ